VFGGMRFDITLLGELQGNRFESIRSYCVLCHYHFNYSCTGNETFRVAAIAGDSTAEKHPRKK
jgi:hypothetical protein